MGGMLTLTWVGHSRVNRLPRCPREREAGSSNPVSGVMPTGPRSTVVSTVVDARGGSWVE